MSEEKMSIRCDNCDVEMIPKNRSEPFTREPITTSTTTPGISATQGDTENSAEVSEWIEFECPECHRTECLEVK